MVKHACGEREGATLNAKEGPRIPTVANSFFEIPVTTKTSVNSLFLSVESCPPPIHYHEYSIYIIITAK